MEETKQILNQKLFNNDIFIVDIIIGYITDTCYICKNKVFINELRPTHIPDNYGGSCNKHDKNNDDEYLCELCIVLNCCKVCEEFCCDKCYNLFACDNKDCINQFCEYCSSRELLECNSCEESFCCKKFYKTIGTNLDYIFTCEDCMTVIQPRY
jgi:hypothetical protein